jgi:hypothetical protein
MEIYLIIQFFFFRCFLAVLAVMFLDGLLIFIHFLNTNFFADGKKKHFVFAWTVYSIFFISLLETEWMNEWMELNEGKKLEIHYNNGRTEDQRRMERLILVRRMEICIFKVLINSFLSEGYELDGNEMESWSVIVFNRWRFHSWIINFQSKVFW